MKPTMSRLTRSGSTRSRSGGSCVEVWRPDFTQRDHRTGSLPVNVRLADERSTLRSANDDLENDDSQYTSGHRASRSYPRRSLQSWGLVRTVRKWIGIPGGHIRAASVVQSPHQGCRVRNRTAARWAQGHVRAQRHSPGRDADLPGRRNEPERALRTRAYSTHALVHGCDLRVRRHRGTRTRPNHRRTPVFAGGIHP